MKVIASYNIKGGVGKTAIALHFAHRAARAKQRVLFWDLDEHGGASFILGRPNTASTSRRGRRTYRLADHVEPSKWEGIDLLPAGTLIHFLDRHDRASHLKELLAKISPLYDWVIADCPPTLPLLGDQILELADAIVVPIVPSPLSGAAFDQLKAYAEARGGSVPKMIPVWSMVDRRRTAHRQALEAEPEWIAIPYSAAVERVAMLGAPLSVDGRANPAAAPFNSLWNRVKDQLSAT